MQQAFATIFFVTQLNNLVVVSKSMRKQGLFYNALDRMYKAIQKHKHCKSLRCTKERVSQCMYCKVTALMMFSRQYTKELVVE